MLRVVLNSACEHLRRRPNWQSSQSLASAESVEADTPVAGETMSHDETRRRVLDELASLSAQQAEAILLRLVEGLSYEEVADSLGCAVATARVHVNRGREKLRDRLQDLNPAKGAF